MRPKAHHFKELKLFAGQMPSNLQQLRVMHLNLFDITSNTQITEFHNLKMIEP